MAAPNPQPQPLYNNVLYDTLATTLSNTQNYENTVERWLLNSDTASLNDVMEDGDGFDSNFATLFDIPTKICSSIPPDELISAEAQSFINEYYYITSEIITHTVGNNLLWNVDINDKFAWIALMLSIYTAPHLIQFLSKNIKKEILLMEDVNGCNCFISACSNIQSLIELIKYYSKDYLKKGMMEKKIGTLTVSITPFDILAYTGGLMQLFDENIVSVEEILQYTNSTTKMNVLHFSSMYSSPYVLEYLLSKNVITAEYLMKPDINANIILIIACIHGSQKAIELLLKSSLLPKSVGTVRNLANQTMNDYMNNIGNMHQLLLENDYIDENTFMTRKLYNRLTINMIKPLFNATFFNADLLIKPIEGSIPQRNLFDIIFTSSNVAQKIISESDTDEKMTSIVNDLVEKHIEYLHKMFDTSQGSFILLIKSKFIKKNHFTRSHSGKTILEKLVDCLSVGEDAEITNDLIDSIIDCNQFDDTVASSCPSFITACINRSPNYLPKIIEKKLLTDVVKLIETLLNEDKPGAIENLLKTNIIKNDQLINEHNLLSRLISTNSFFLDYVLEKNMFTKELMNFYVTDGVVLIFLPKPYELTTEQFRLIIKNENVSTYLLNSFDEYQDDTSSILYNVKTIDKLNVLLEERKDFDHSMFFRKNKNGKQSSYLINILNNSNMLIKKDSKLIASYLFNLSGFTADVYNDLIEHSILANHFADKELGTMLLTHKHLNKKIYDLRFDQYANIIMMTLLWKYDNNVILHLINSEFVDKEILQYKNNRGQNCLLVAYKTRNYNIVNEIANNKYFSCEMLTQKSSDKESALDIMYKYPNVTLLMKYMEAYEKNNSQGNSIIYDQSRQIIQKILDLNVNIDDVIKLLRKCGFDILFTGNDSNKNKSGLHILMEKYSSSDINIMVDELYKENLLGSINVITDNENVTPIMTLIARDYSVCRDVFEHLVKYNVLSEDMFEPELVIFIIKNNSGLLDVLKDTFKMDVEKMLLQKDKTQTLLYFNSKIIFEHYDLVTEKSLYSVDSKGTTLLEHFHKFAPNMVIGLIKQRVITKDMLLLIINKITSSNNVSITKENKDDTILLEYIITNPNNVITDDDLQYIFSNDKMITYISNCIKIKSEKVRILCGSKYFNIEIMEHLDKIAIINMTKSNSGMKYLFDNGFVNKITVKMDNYKLVRELNNPQYIKRIISLIEIKTLTEIEFNNNNDGSILHKFALYPDLITYLLTEQKSDTLESIDKLLLATNKLGKSFMHILINHEYFNDITKIIEIYKERNIVLLKALLIQCDSSGNNVLMMIVKSKGYNIFNKEIKELHEKYNLLDETMLLETNKDGESLLSSSIGIIDVEFLKQLLNKIDISKNINTNIFEQATMHNPDNLQLLLTNPELVKYDFTKCFALACRWQPKSIKPLLKTGNVDLHNCYDLIKIEDDNGVENYMANYIQIACRYNIESVRELLYSDVYMVDALNEVNIDNKNRPLNAFILAIMYEPESVKLLIDSKYITKEYILLTNELLGMNCLCFAMDIQLASYRYMTDNKQFDDFKKDDEFGTVDNRFKTRIHYTYYNSAIKIDDSYLKHKDILCTMRDPEACSICCANKNKVIFTPCGHKTCVSCAAKLSVCDKCRTQITHKLVYQ